MSEQSYQKKLIKQYEDDGWYVIKLIKTNRNGIPDLLCLKRDHKPTFIEVKGKNGKLSKLQEYRINELIKHGFSTKIKYET